MGLQERIRFLFRLALLLTLLVAVALVSAVATIRLTINSNQETLPKLVGMPLNQAERIAGSLGLEIRVEDRLYNAKHPANEIVSQMPIEGTRVKEGQHVHVLVSLGPPRVTMPDMAGGSLRAAQIIAMQRGLTVGEVAQIHGEGLDAGQVVAQDPPPSGVPTMSPQVNFLVSLGDLPASYVCPSLVGMRLALARSAVEASGFRVGRVSSVPGPGPSAAPGTIASQSPAPGSRITTGTSFEFQVAD